MAVNKVILLGNLGQDPEVRHLESGAQVANVSVATSESWKDKEGNKQESTEWHNLVFWGALAGVVENHLSKGDKIYVEGKIKSDTWQDDQGNNRKTVKIRVLSMDIISCAKWQDGEPKKPSATARTKQAVAKKEPMLEAEEDNLPF